MSLPSKYSWVEIIGGVMLVDTEDLPKINSWKNWRVSKGHNGRGIPNLYVVTYSGVYGSGKKEIRLHRLLMAPQSNEVVDHINGNTLDNRKENLRVCTQAENCRNTRRPKTNTSGYKGISWISSRNRWFVSIRVNNKTVPLGRYVNLEDAVTAYDKAAIKFHGEFASPNRPRSTYETDL